MLRKILSCIKKQQKLWGSIILYDPIFYHRTIKVNVGVSGRIRLRMDGFFTAYFDQKGDTVTYFFIVRCDERGHCYLADMAYQEKHCPVCSLKMDAEKKRESGLGRKVYVVST